MQCLVCKWYAAYIYISCLFTVDVFPSQKMLHLNLFSLIAVQQTNLLQTYAPGGRR